MIVIDHNRIIFELHNPLKISVKEKVEIRVFLDISSNAPTSLCLGLELIEVATSSESGVTINHQTRSIAYINKVPGTITIDGAFADWNEFTKFQDMDSNFVNNPNYDLQDFSIVDDEEKLNFLFRVKAELLSGNELAIQLNPLYRRTGSEFEGVQKLENEPKRLDIESIPQEFIPKNTFRLFFDIDSDITTGFHPTWLPQGAEYMLEITGRHGKIIDRALFIYNPPINKISSLDMEVCEVYTGSEGQIKTGNSD
jgi:hypothetical protein